jgi:hypothetical protein
MTQRRRIRSSSRSVVSGDAERLFEFLGGNQLKLWARGFGCNASYEKGKEGESKTHGDRLVFVHTSAEELCAQRGAKDLGFCSDDGRRSQKIPQDINT